MKLKNIRGFKGYWVSDLGDVYSTKSGQKVKLKTWKNAKGYLKVKLQKDSKGVNFRVHRLVLMEWRPVEYPENYQVNHLDLDKENNRLDNLCWSTGKENVEHAMINGRIIANKDIERYLELREKVYSPPSRS